MVMMIVIVFTVLNPLVIPFTLVYFSAAVGAYFVLPIALDAL
jgi:hypothetical protein